MGGTSPLICRLDPKDCQQEKGDEGSCLNSKWRKSTESLKIVNSAKIQIKKVNLKTFDDGMVQMKLKLDSKINTPNTPTSCFIHSKGLNNRNRAKIIPVANKAFETEVYCEKVSMPSNVYEAGIIYGNNEKSLRACLNSMTVTYQSNQTLKILEAFAKIKQRTIVLKFDNNIQCTNSFEDIFEPLLNVTDDSVPKIKCKGDDKLKISVNDDFPIEDFFGKDSNQKLVFKEGNKVRSLGSDVKLSNGMKAGFAVVLNKRGGKNLGNGKKPNSLKIRGPNAFCYSEPKCFRVKLRGKSGQNRKDKSIDGENDVNVEVTVQKRISDVYAGNGNENATSTTTTVRRESVKLGQREGRKNTKRNGNNKRRKGGLKTEYCMDEELEEGTYTINVTIGKESISEEFSVASKEDTLVTGIKKPRKSFSDK